MRRGKVIGNIAPLLVDEELDLGPNPKGRPSIRPTAPIVLGETNCEECDDVGVCFDDDGRYLCGQCLFETEAMKEI